MKLVQGHAHAELIGCMAFLYETEWILFFLLALHLACGSMQGPNKFSLVKFVVACDKSSRRNHLFKYKQLWTNNGDDNILRDLKNESCNDMIKNMQIQDEWFF